MRSLLFISLVLLGQSVLAQQNLVVNGSFENPPACPGQGVPFEASASGWFAGTELGNPDHFHTCVTIDPLAVPCNWRGCQEPRTGNGYAGIWSFSKLHPEGRDYIQTELTEPLHTSVRYEVRFYVSLAEKYGGYAVSTIGAALTAEPPDTIDAGYRLNADPQVLHSGLPLTDTVNWVLIIDTIVSRGDNEKYLTIGNFRSDAESDTLLFNPDAQVTVAYYFIDDVSVVALDSVPSRITDFEQNKVSILLYPNPTRGELTVDILLNEDENASIEVFNLIGQNVFSQALSKNEVNKIDLSQLTNGIYTVRLVVDGNIRRTEKLSIAK